MSYMEAVQAYFNGNAFVPTAPFKAKINQQAIVTILDSIVTEPAKQWYDEFFGVLSAEDASDIAEALRDTEKVDVNEW